MSFVHQKKGEMEVKKSSEILSALKLEEFASDKQFMYIEELDNADGSFIISSIIKDEIEKNEGVILILCHNSLGHFYSIGQKLGYNLMALQESQEVFCIDTMNEIVNKNFNFNNDPLKNVYYNVKKHIDYFDNKNQNFCIVVEGIGNFLLAQISNTFNFVQYLRELVIEREHSKMICSFHNFPTSWNFNSFSKELKHIADIVVIIKDLATGKSNDITGHLTITVKDEQFLKWTVEYHYLLKDKRIYVFVPGAKEFVECR